jgi:RNA polymerase sigma-70 factor (ECF subfamily)
MDPIRQIYKKLRRTVIRNGAPSDDADDIVQEAFARLEVYAQSHKVQNQEAFLMQVALNINRDQAKRRARGPIASVPLKIPLDAIADLTPQPDEIVHARERLRHAKAGLGQLEDVTRRCLLAHRLEGMTYADIAAREGLPITTVEKRVARALLSLSKWMDGC